MGCTLFWEAQEFSGQMQVKCRDELIALAEAANWEYEVAPDVWTGTAINLNARPERARPMTGSLRTIGVTLFPFGRDEDDTRPRLSFVFDNSDLSNPDTRNRLITIAPAAYWREWMPRLRGQYPALSEERSEPLYGIRTDGQMRVRRTDLPGFIKFLNTLRATALPLLDIRTSDRLARKMIHDPSAAVARGGDQSEAEQASLADLGEDLGNLLSEGRYPDWKLALEAEDDIEREQMRANRAASMSQGGGERGRGGGRGRGGDERSERRFPGGPRGY